MVADFLPQWIGQAQFPTLLAPTEALAAASRPPAGHNAALPLDSHTTNMCSTNTETASSDAAR